MNTIERSIYQSIAITVLLCLGACAQPSTKVATTSLDGQRTFATPEEAGEALIAAAAHFNVATLKEILGPDGVDLVVTDDHILDKKQAVDFARQARLKAEVVRDPQNPDTVTLSIGPEAWPGPIPLVLENGRWRFDTEAGRQEVLLRRIGTNELDAIEVCRGFVEAQEEYAEERHDGSKVNQYAQRIISTPGRQDGLAWQTADGTWEGPVGREIADFIAEGYTDELKPFHGYCFKILKGQGPDAPMGEMDFVYQGVMLAGFGLVAAPSNYGVTGVKTFIVSHTGTVFEKDLGETTLEQFRAMELFNPDATWTAVPEPPTPVEPEAK